MPFQLQREEIRRQRARKKTQRGKNCRVTGGGGVPYLLCEGVIWFSRGLRAPTNQSFSRAFSPFFFSFPSRGVPFWERGAARWGSGPGDRVNIRHARLALGVPRGHHRRRAPSSPPHGFLRLINCVPRSREEPPAINECGGGRGGIWRALSPSAHYRCPTTPSQWFIAAFARRVLVAEKKIPLLRVLNAFHADRITPILDPGFFYYFFGVFYPKITIMNNIRIVVFVLNSVNGRPTVLSELVLSKRV